MGSSPEFTRWELRARRLARSARACPRGCCAASGAAGTDAGSRARAGGCAARADAGTDGGADFRRATSGAETGSADNRGCTHAETRIRSAASAFGSAARSAGACGRVGAVLTALYRRSCSGEGAGVRRVRQGRVQRG